MSVYTLNTGISSKIMAENIINLELSFNQTLVYFMGKKLQVKFNINKYSFYLV